jgi:hypothetical protein
VKPRPHYRQNSVQIVVRRAAVRPFEFASPAPVDDNETGPTLFDGNRLHKAAASRRPVSRMDIDVKAAKAGRAVVRISVAGYGRATVCTDEILDPPLKVSCHARLFAQPPLRRQAGRSVGQATA